MSDAERQIKDLGKYESFSEMDYFEDESPLLFSKGSDEDLIKFIDYFEERLEKISKYKHEYFRKVALANLAVQLDKKLAASTLDNVTYNICKESIEDLLDNAKWIAMDGGIDGNSGVNYIESLPKQDQQDGIRKF